MEVSIGADRPQLLLEVVSDCKPILTIHNHTHEEVQNALRNYPETLRKAIVNLFDVVEKLCGEEDYQ